MNQRELIKVISAETHIAEKVVERVIKIHAAVIAGMLKNGQEVTLHQQLGKLTVSQSAQREGRNPATGEAIVIPAKRVVRFKAAKGLKEAINP